MAGGDGVALSVVFEGIGEASRFESLTRRLGRLDLIEAPAGASSQPSVLNPLVDDAAAPWILIVRQGELVPDDLAAEIERSATSSPRAWGYRIAIHRVYCGRPLALGAREAGEVRLFHRRKARLQPDGRMKVQGTVVRLEEALSLTLHESRDQHVEWIRSHGGKRAGLVRQLLRWVKAVAQNGPRALSSPTRAYLWIESGWQREGQRSGVEEEGIGC